MARPPAHTKFCTTHKCKHSDCRAESKVPGGFCLTYGHACQKPECKERRLDDNSDGLCAGHRIKQLEEKVKDVEKKKDMEKKEEVEKVIKEMEEQNQQKKATQPVETNSPPAKEKEEARKEQPKSKDQPRYDPADAMVPRDSIDDQPLRSSIIGQDPALHPRSPPAGDSVGFTPVIMLMPSSFMSQFTNWVNPMHFFRLSGNQNREQNLRLESQAPRRSTWKI